MATYTVEQIYDYLRFGECGNFVQFQCKQRTVTIRRLTTWADNADRARKLAEQLRSTGYSVDVWQHTKDGAQKTDI